MKNDSVSIEVLAKRKTHDNKTVMLWADGQITQSFGIWLPGIAPRKHTTGKLQLADAWVVMDEVCLWDMNEVCFLIEAARKMRARSKAYVIISGKRRKERTNLFPGDVRKLAVCNLTASRVKHAKS